MTQKQREHASAGGPASDEPLDDEDAEFFARYERAEDSAAVPAPAARRAAVDPTVDLAADQNDSFSGGFGIGHDPRKVRTDCDAVGLSHSRMPDRPVHSWLHGQWRTAWSL